MKVGTTLTLEAKSLDSAKEIKLRSKIIDKNDRYLFIDPPVNIKTKKTTYLPKNSEIKAFFVDQNEILYTFTTKSIRRINLNVPALAIKRPQQESIRKIQRREFVRVNFALDIAVHCPDQSFPPFTTVTLDISGGGLQMIVPKERKLKKGQSLHIWIALPRKSRKLTYIDTKSEVVRVDQQEHGREVVSVAFKSLTHLEEQQIVQFCYEKQREKRLSIS